VRFSAHMKVQALSYDWHQLLYLLSCQSLSNIVPPHTPTNSSKLKLAPTCTCTQTITCMLPIWTKAALTHPNSIAEAPPAFICVLSISTMSVIPKNASASANRMKTRMSNLLEDMERGRWGSKGKSRRNREESRKVWVVLLVSHYIINWQYQRAVL